MSILNIIFDKLKRAKPKGSIDMPKPKEIKIKKTIHADIYSFIDYTSSAVNRLMKLDKLMRAPKIEFIKDVHTKAVLESFKGLGVITIIFDSESGKPLFAELKEEIDNEQ